MKDLQEFARYLAHLGAGLGHADRQAGLRGYCRGLMAPLKRKSVEPMAAHLAPSATRSRHQSLHHFVADSAWSDEQMLLRVAQWVMPAMDFSDGGWWIVDDTGFPKQGQHSVGVARQYCRMLGKQEQLPSSGERDAGVPSGQPASGLVVVPARGMGRGHGATREGWRSARLGIRYQAGDCAGADRAADRARCAQALRAGRCRLWCGDGVSKTPERVGSALRGGRDRPGDGVATGARAAATRAVGVRAGSILNGRPSNGARAPTSPCDRDSPAFACMQRTAIISARSCVLRSGFSSSGPRVTANR